MAKHWDRKWLILAALLLPTLGIKLQYLSHNSVLDSARLQQDLAKAVAPAGFSLSRTNAPLERFDALTRTQSGTCHANIAIADYGSVNLDFLRGLHRQNFAHHSEFLGRASATKVPTSYIANHYIAHALAPLGIDFAVTPYVLMGWDAGCPAPAPGFGGVKLYYRS